MPGREAEAAGHYTRHFSNKVKAQTYHKELSRQFPNERHSIFRVSPWECDGKPFRTKGEAEAYQAERDQWRCQHIR
jgi:hypothetical protein